MPSAFWQIDFKTGEVSQVEMWGKGVERWSPALQRWLRLNEDIFRTREAALRQRQNKETEIMTEPETVREGWQTGKHPGQRVCHYIVGTFPLCGKPGCCTGELSPHAGKKEPGDCAECFRRIEKRNKK